MTVADENSLEPRPSALIVCNGQAPARELLLRHWSAVGLRVAADGGANTLAEMDLLPDVVVGDLDSLKPEVRERLSSEAVVRVLEQDTNDADKATRYCLEQGLTEVHLFGADGGRADQFLANLEVMLRHSRQARLCCGPRGSAWSSSTVRGRTRWFRKPWSRCCLSSALCGE